MKTAGNNITSSSVRAGASSNSGNASSRSSTTDDAGDGGSISGIGGKARAGKMTAGASAARDSAANSSIWRPSGRARASKYLAELQCRNEDDSYGTQNSTSRPPEDVSSLGMTLDKVLKKENSGSCAPRCTYGVHKGYISSLEMTLPKKKEYVGTGKLGSTPEHPEGGESANCFSSHEITLAEAPEKKEKATTGKQDGTCRVQANRFSGFEMTMSEKKGK